MKIFKRESRKRRVRRLTVVPAAVVAMIAIAAPAMAANFDLHYGPSAYGGYGRAYGSIDFENKKTFSYNTHITDLCPGDYLGTSQLFAITFGNGTQTLTGYVVKDTNGCGNGWEVAASLNNTYANNVKLVRAQTCWTNDGNLCWAYADASTWKTNPYV